MHPVLLGDSVFHNTPYVGEGQDVISQLRELLGPDTPATLLAVDGSVSMEIEDQLRDLPADASHLFVSVGGNDALAQAGFLDENAKNVANVLRRMRDIIDEFIEVYEQMLDAVQKPGLPVCVSTIYYPRFPHPGTQKAALAALAVINDCILTSAIGRGLPIIDMRRVCDDLLDYANPIEPSAKGSVKIAAAVHRVLNERDWSTGRTEVFF